MYFSGTLLLAFAAALPAFAAPFDTPKVVVPHTAPKNETMSIASAPQWYSGPWWKFPAMNTWITFYDMFDRNKPSMLATGSTHDDVGRIFNAIVAASAQIGVDERVILGIIMQESHGNVGVVTTWNMDGQPTAGLMQCLNCPGFPGRHGLSQNEITSMIIGGTQHYKRDLVTEGNKWSAESIYPALRRYNSGNVNHDNLSDGLGATGPYVSDLAQRLQGWVD